MYIRVASPEIELVTPAAPKEGANIGHEGVRRFFTEMETFAGSSRFEVEEIRAVGPQVLAFSPLSGVGRISRINTSSKVVGVYSFEGGKIRRAQVFTDHEAAFDAAGLAE